MTGKTKTGQPVIIWKFRQASLGILQGLVLANSTTSRWLVTFVEGQGSHGGDNVAALSVCNFEPILSRLACPSAKDGLTGITSKD